MQFLGPALNGTYAYGCLLALFSGENRVGSNRSGSGYTTGSRCKLTGNTATVVPDGIVYPAVNTRIKSESSCSSLQACCILREMKP